MRPFHNRFGVPARFPAPLAVNPALYANLSSQTPHMRVYLLTNAARDDFMAKFPALGFADTLSGSGLAFTDDFASALECAAFVVTQALLGLMIVTDEASA